MGWQRREWWQSPHLAESSPGNVPVEPPAQPGGGSRAGGQPIVHWVLQRAALVTLAAVCLLLTAALSAERAYREADLRQFASERDYVEHKLRAVTQVEGSARHYNGYYLTVDLDNNEVRVMRDGNVIHRASCAHGKGRVQQRGRWFDFTTPVGRRTVINKEVDPVWLRPDWVWLERGDSVPRMTREQREVRGALGKYRLQTGEGYDIHGIDGPVLPGEFTHGCVRLKEEDLAAVYRFIDVGAPVYIY
ncbi:MAG TPA: L,D-transpeptidase [bacterium]|nr:L,D-transpeptidase [bacterium]